jgi:hypothetical protein
MQPVFDRKKTPATNSSSRRGQNKKRGSSGLRNVEPTQIGSAQGSSGLAKSSERIQLDQSCRREERGSSFCDILPTKSSRAAPESHSSINLEDDGSVASDAGLSDEFGGSHITANRSANEED